MADERGTSAVVGKALEASIVVLYIGLLSATLFGSVVPGYRTAAGATVGDRVLAKSAERIQQAVPPTATAVRAEVRVNLPRTIRGRAYQIRVENRTLVLDHPNAAITSRTRLALPDSVTDVRGSWSSREPTTISVRKTDDGLTVVLTSEGSD